MALSPSQWELIRMCSKDEVAFFTLRHLIERALLQTPSTYQEYLDTLPAHVAVLDSHGTIVAVNRAWQRFADANHLQMSQHGVGANYLAICEAASDLPDAQQAAYCIREILEGRAQECEFEYTCHGPNEMRWFSMRVTPFALDNERGVLVAHINATARTMSMMALTKTQELYRLLAENTADLVSLHNPDGTFLYTSPSFERLTGYTLAELQMSTAEDLIHPDELPIILNAQANLFERGELDGVLEYRLRLRDGGYRWLESAAQAIRDEQGKVVQLLISGRDVTERKNAETALRENQQFIEKVMAAIPSIVYVYDLVHNRNVFVNREVAVTLGYSPQEIAAMGSEILQTIMPPEDYEKQFRELVRFATARDDDIIEAEYNFKHANGELRTLYIRNAIFARNADGSLRQILGIAQDITERKQAERALRQTEARYRQLLEHMPLAIAVMDIETLAMVFLNPAAQEFLRVNATDVLTFPGWAQTLSPEERSTVAAILQQWDSGKIMPPTEIRTHDADGSERFILAQSLPIIYEGRQSLLNILTDITEHKRIGQTEVEKEELARAFEQQQEMNHLKTRILTRISHEFRTPLAIIMSAAELLDRYFERLTQVKRQMHLDQIAASVERLARLLENIEQILQTSRLELYVFDLEKLCTDIVRRIQVADNGRHTILFASGGNLARVYADARRMEYLISNLMTNALRYSNEGSTIYVDLTAGDGEIIFRVSDEGRGISEQDLPRIFEPFFRGENVGDIGGMGISLSIVKEIVDLHRGDIGVESTLGRGTTVTVRMPLLVDSLRM